MSQSCYAPARRAGMDRLGAAGFYRAMRSPETATFCLEEAVRRGLDASAAVGVCHKAVAVTPSLSEFRPGAGRGEEWRTKEALGAVRSALSLYYGDHEGRYPDDFNALIEDGYLSGIPFTSLPGTSCADSADILLLRDVSTMAEIRGALTNRGGYAYVIDPESPLYGYFVVNCLEPDSKGVPWYLH